MNGLSVHDVGGGKVLMLHEHGNCVSFDLLRMLDSMGLSLDTPCTPEWAEGGEYPW